MGVQARALSLGVSAALFILSASFFVFQFAFSVFFFSLRSVF